MEGIILEYFKEFSTNDTWRITIVVIFLILVVPQRLANLSETWSAFRQSRGKLLLEKQQLEILKLRYEIEVLRKTNQLPEITSIPFARQTAEGTRTAPSSRSLPWSWLTKHQLFGKILLRVVQVIVGGLLLFFVLLLIFTPILAFTDESFPSQGPWITLSVFIIYGIFAYGSYRIFRQLGIWVKGLDSGKLPHLETSTVGHK